MYIAPRMYQNWGVPALYDCHEKSACQQCQCKLWGKSFFNQIHKNITCTFHSSSVHIRLRKLSANTYRILSHISGLPFEWNSGYKNVICNFMSIKCLVLLLLLLLLLLFTSEYVPFSRQKSLHTSGEFDCLSSIQSPVNSRGPIFS